MRSLDAKKKDLTATRPLFDQTILYNLIIGDQG